MWLWVGFDGGIGGVELFDAGFCESWFGGFEVDFLAEDGEFGGGWWWRWNEVAEFSRKGEDVYVLSSIVVCGGRAGLFA